jgi:predicted permease
LWLLFAAVGLVLLAACGNVACLLLAEATRRRHEVAIRIAVGASRWTVVRHLLAEGLVLALASAACALVFARWATAALTRLAADLPRVHEVHADSRLVAFTLLAGILTTVVFALAPALQATRVDPADALARGGRGQIGRHRLQELLVATQIAAALVLLVGAGLVIRSFARLAEVSPGFEPAGVLTFRMSASWSENGTSVVSRLARTLRRLEEVPGVDAAAVSQTLPAGTDFPPGEFSIVGRDAGEKLFAHARGVSSGYFRALRIPVLQGETCEDDPAAPIFSRALVTRAFADRYFPGEDPIGHAIGGPNLPPGRRLTITGIVGDVRENGLMHAPEPLIYWCGYSPYWPDPYFVVRSNAAHPASVAAIRSALAEIEPKRAMYAVRPLVESLSRSMAQQRLNTVLLSLFAATALLVAALGVYGVLSQLVAGQRRDIGVRLALGARGRQILAALFTHVAAMITAGTIAGLAIAAAVSRLMTTLLFGISAHDPLTFVFVPLVLAAAACGAALIPARRALRVAPAEALRDE